MAFDALFIGMSLSSLTSVAVWRSAILGEGPFNRGEGWCEGPECRAALFSSARWVFCRSNPPPLSAKRVIRLSFWRTRPLLWNE
jgi:hypothetical protein